ncbi:MAG: alpha/beta fold hydrolase [Chitinophagaceae bacterium]|nr:alpha/beta fold hydrolase [Chitinophagaceae bacterium]
MYKPLLSAGYCLLLWGAVAAQKGAKQSNGAQSVLDRSYAAGQSYADATLQGGGDTAKRKALLQKIVELLPPDRVDYGPVSFLDKTFKDWLARTGELPPDFDKLPSIPFLPDPLLWDEGGKNTPITTRSQWQNKRVEMKKALQYYITGDYPAAPSNLEVKTLSETKDGQTTIRRVELRFGPEQKARLTVELMIPEGRGPFPVFLTQWNHRGWAQIAVRRGYIGCIYAGADIWDDTEQYSELWASQYDFTRLMRRAFGASRAIDYLYMLPFVDRDKIGMTGHSRNGKQSLWAAAFDDRIKAVIPSSGGSGAEVPWRYASHKYDVEDIALLACAQPSWLHPRLRFFVGREDKLPVDQHFFMALIAPRALMLSAAYNESAANPLGIEEAYRVTRKVYKFLGAERNIAIRFRDGLHGTRAGDIEEYIDFFDYVFHRSDRKPANTLLYDHSFEDWRQLSGERINLQAYAPKKAGDLLIKDRGQKINTVEDWEIKKGNIQKTLHWALGDPPSGVSNPGPVKWDNGGAGENYFGNVLHRPETDSLMGRMALTPYNEFGDYLYGYLYYPKHKEAEIRKGDIRLPVVVYLHEYDYSKGFSSEGLDHQIRPYFQELTNRGYAVFAYDFMGFGNRITEGTHFYQRYPHWSKMGKLVTDLQGAVDALSHLNFIDSARIFVTGYSLGATVGLYTAALDKRIAGVVSVCGFAPMRLDGPDKGGVKAYADIHGLLPRLGFFVGNENRIPYDFHEILACIAPRPVLIVSPKLDKEAALKEVQSYVEEAGKAYRLYGQPGNIRLYAPDDYNRFSADMRQKTYEWLEAR